MTAIAATPLPADIPGAYGTEATADCRRCAGTGFFHSKGFCFNCQGGGKVTFKRYTKPEKVEIERWATWRNHALALICTRADEREANINASERDLKDQVRSGFDRLEQDEPARLLCLFASIRDGRVDAVIDGLGEYSRRRAGQ